MLQEVRMGEICQVNLMGNVQISTQAVQALCEAEVPICYFSMGGWFYGITTGLNQKNVFLRRSQFRLAEQEYFRAGAGAAAGGGEDPQSEDAVAAEPCGAEAGDAGGLKEMAERAERAARLEELLGIEGNAARLYFGEFRGNDQAGRRTRGCGGCRSISRGGTGVRRGIR